MLGLVLLFVLEPPAKPSPVRVDLQAGAGWRDDTVDRPQSDATATGSAFSDLALRLALFPAAHVGLGASVRAGRFTLTPAEGVAGPEHVDQRSLDAAGALAARATLARLTVEGQLGYGYLRLPAAVIFAGPAGEALFAGTSVRGHGPYGAASLRLALGRFGLEAAGEARPVVWGADYAGTSVDPRWFAVRGGATVDAFTLGRSLWSVLVSYELGEARASGQGTRLGQSQRSLALGLRATWLPPQPPPPALAPTPAPVVRLPAPPAPGAISGVVHGVGNLPVAASVSLVELGLTMHADPQGAFRFDVPSGQYTLTVEADGYLPQSKGITVRPGEQHIYNLELQPVAP